MKMDFDEFIKEYEDDLNECESCEHLYTCDNVFMDEYDGYIKECLDGKRRNEVKV